MPKNTPAPEAPAVEDAPVEDVVEEVPAVDVAALLATHADAVAAEALAIAAAKAADEAIGTLVRTAREAKGQARPQVARNTGLTVASLAGIELGRRATVEELRNLGAYLGIEALASL